MSYSTDGRCHNANRGTYGHECGNAATWIGEDRKGFRCGFCADCRRHGDEAQVIVSWQPFNLAHEIAIQINRNYVDDRGIVDEVAMREIFNRHGLPAETRIGIWRSLTENRE